jgi:GTP-binding protein
MRFLDEAVISAKSGDGGRGCVSFRREKFIPKGGPDGGNGGNGGNIIVRATGRLHTLADYNSRKHFQAQKGRPGSGKNQTGKDGLDITIAVPVGTLIYDVDTGECLADLVRDGEEVFLLRGGRGGKGNQHFATSTNRAPRMAQPGLPGQQKKLRLSLKTLADIGLIGLPNAGKSTLLSRLTMARPKIDQYPFTTINPNLGVMTFDDGMALTVADIPGLIEGASEGRGLGHRFLKHIERTRVLLHVLDITAIPVQELLEDYHTLLNELEKFDPLLKDKTQVVLINKIDMAGQGGRDIQRLKEALEALGVDFIAISALTGEGLDELKNYLHRLRKVFLG